MQGKTVPGFDKLVNFTEVIVSTGYDASATSIVLQAGEGTKLPDPAVYGSYYGIWHDVTAEFLASADAKREWVLINTVSGDTITSLTRAQQETSASTKNEIGHQYRISIVLSAAQMEKYNQLQNNGISRQALVNSNFNIWGAGTSYSDPTTGSTTADKWNAGFVKTTGTFPTVVHSRQSLTSGDVFGSFYNYRINTNGAGSSLASTENYKIYQDIVNGTRFLSGVSKQVTVSFYAKSSIASKKLGINIIQNYGTGGSPSADENITGDNITLTSDWKFYSFTYTLNTLVGKTFGTNNDDYIRLQLWTMWQSGTQSQVGASSAESFGGSGNVEVAQVQVCSGDVALEYKQDNLDIEQIISDGFASRIVRKNSLGYVPNAFIKDPVFTLGENVSFGDALYYGYVDQFITDTTSPAYRRISGGSGTEESQAQTFTTTRDMEVIAVKLKLFKESSPVDNLIVRIETTSAGVPTGTLVHANATGTISASSLTTSTSGANYKISFAGEFTLSSGVVYAVVLTRSGARDTTNRVVSPTNTTVLYSGGSSYSKNSGTWSINTGEDIGLLQLITTDVGKAISTDSEKTKFIGFSDRTASAYTSVEPFSGGMITGLSGLAPGTVYVLGNTAGGIKAGTTPYTSEVIVGYAINSTDLIIKNFDFFKLL